MPRRPFTLADIAAHYARQGWALPAELRGINHTPHVLQPTAGDDPRAVAGDAAIAQGARGETLQPSLTLTLPYPPSGNNLYPTGRDGKRHLSAAARAYRQAVAAAVQAQWLTMQPRPVLPLRGRLVATVWLYAPDRHRRDIMDNSNKLLFDALTACGVLEDDSQIDEGHVYRGAVSPVARVEVELREKGRT